MLVEQALRERRVAVGKPDAGHLENLLLGRERLGAKQVTKLAAGLSRECDAAPALVVLADEGDRVRHGEVGGRVAGALPLRPRDERGRLAVARADDRRLCALLPLGPHVEEA